MEEAAHKALRARAPARVRAAGALEYRSVGVFSVAVKTPSLNCIPLAGIEAAHLAQAPLHHPGFEHEDEQKHEHVFEFLGRVRLAG
jgi:hypothetical protein